jgi:hypothetical protein
MDTAATHAHKSQRRPVRRAARVVTVLAAVGMFAAACSHGSAGPGGAGGGSSTPSGQGSSTGLGGSSDAGRSQSAQLLAFARCVRSNSVPSFPDPTSEDKFPDAAQLGVSNAVYQAAMNACRHLLPNGGTAPKQAELQQDLTTMLSFSQCMRHRGVPNWPDPTLGPHGRPGFNLVGVPGVGDSPQVTAAQHQCGHLLPSTLGGIPVSQ